MLLEGTDEAAPAAGEAVTAAGVQQPLRRWNNSLHGFLEKIWELRPLPACHVQV